jgi:hypothetical protein
MQPESLILLPIAIGLLVVLVLVRRGMDQQRSVQTLEIAIECDTTATRAELKLVTAELERQAELAERIAAATKRSSMNPAPTTVVPADLRERVVGDLERVLKAPAPRKKPKTQTRKARTPRSSR